MAFCPQCGWALDAGALACPKCGTPVDGQGPGPGTASPPPAAAPISVGELLGAPVRRVFERFGTYFGTQGVPILLGVVIGTAVSMAAVYLLAAPTGAPGFGATFSAALTTIAAGLVAGVLAFVLNVVAGGIGVVVSDELDRDATPTLGSAWERVRPRLATLLLTSLLLFAVIVAAFLPAILLVVTGAGMDALVLAFPALALAAAGACVVVWLLVMWAVAVPVVVFEGRAPWASLQRSAQLTKGSRGALFGTFLVILVAAFVYGLVTDFIPGLFPVGATIVSAVLGAFSSLVVGFVTASITTHAYKRLAPPAAQPESSAPSADAMRPA